MKLWCLFGCHAWRIVDPSDWRTDDPFSWGIASGYGTTIGGPRVRVTCGHCGKRDHATFTQLTRDEAWRRGVEQEWQLEVNGRAVEGGPPSGLIDRCFRAAAPVWGDIDPFGVSLVEMT